MRAIYVFSTGITRLDDAFVLYVSFFSEILGKKVRLKVSSRGIKTVEKKGGIDNYVITSKSSVLAPEILKLKKLIESKRDIKN